MPHAVTHILIPLILLELIRDYFIKSKKKFPLQYVLICGIAGLLPDIDIFLSWFGLNIPHRMLTHSLIIPAAFLLIGLIANNRNKAKFRTLFLVVSFGIFTHLLIDALVIGPIIPFYPFSQLAVGLNLVSIVPIPSETLIPGIDAILLIAWLVHEEIRHKISSFY